MLIQLIFSSIWFPAAYSEYFVSVNIHGLWVLMLYSKRSGRVTYQATLQRIFTLLLNLDAGMLNLYQ